MNCMYIWVLGRGLDIVNDSYIHVTAGEGVTDRRTGAGQDGLGEDINVIQGLKQDVKRYFKLF